MKKNTALLIWYIFLFLNFPIFFISISVKPRNTHDDKKFVFKANMNPVQKKGLTFIARRLLSSHAADNEIKPGWDS